MLITSLYSICYSSMVIFSILHIPSDIHPRISVSACFSGHKAKIYLFSQTFIGKFYSVGRFDDLVEDSICGDGGASGECGVPQVRQHRNHGTRARRPSCRSTVAVWRVMGVADGEEQPSGCGAEAGTLITPLIPNESLRTACRVLSRMSMMIPISSPGRTCSGPWRVSCVLHLRRSGTESAWPQDRQFRVGCG